jgi:hypothetical protein
MDLKTLLPLPAVAAALLGPAAASAQSFEEAVRANLLLALQLCMIEDRANVVVAAFTAAGFQYWRDDQSMPNFLNVYHRFHAPADTVSVELYEGDIAPHCRAESRHIGPTATAQMIGPWLEQTFPGQFEYRPPGTVIHGSTTDCPSFWIPEPPGGLPFEVWIGTASEGETCATAQTVTVMPGRHP